MQVQHVTIPPACRPTHGVLERTDEQRRLLEGHGARVEERPISTRLEDYLAALAEARTT